MPERPGDMDERDVDARFASIIARWDSPDPAADGSSPSETTTDAVRAPSADPSPTTRVEGEEGTEGVEGSPGGEDGTAATGDPAAASDAEPDAVEPDATEPDATEPDATEPVLPASPRSPWVNPSPLDLVVPPSAWRAAEPADPGSEAAAARSEEEVEVEHFEPPEVVLPPQEDLHFWGAVIGLVAGPLMLLYVVFARPFHSTRWFVAAVVVSLLGFALLILRQPKHRDPMSGDDGARV